MSNSEKTPPLSDAEGEWTLVSKNTRQPSRGGGGGGGGSGATWERGVHNNRSNTGGGGARNNTGRGGASWERGAHNNRNNTGCGGGGGGGGGGNYGGGSNYGRGGRGHANNRESNAATQAQRANFADQKKKADKRRAEWEVLASRIKHLFEKCSGPDRTERIVSGVRALCVGKDEAQVAKITEEVIRYLDADVIRLLSDIIAKSRTRDGYSALHWAVYPINGLCDNMSADEALTRIRNTIRVLIDVCECSPFKMNKYNETCIEAARSACTRGMKGRECFPAEILSDVIDALLANHTSSAIQRSVLTGCLNKMGTRIKTATTSKTDTDPAAKSAMICWAAMNPDSLKYLASQCVELCMRCHSSARQDGMYVTIAQTLGTVINLLNHGPLQWPSLDRFFEQNPFNSAEIVRAFKQYVVDMVKAVNPTEVNEAIMTPDTLGAILAEVGSEGDIDAYIAWSIENGFIMNAMTCIGHSRRLTPDIALTIAATQFDKRTTFYIEDLLSKFAKTQVRMSDVPNLIYRNNMPVGLRRASRGASAASNNRGAQAVRVSVAVSAPSALASPSQQTGGDYVPAFDESAPSFGIINLAGIDPSKLSKKKTGELLPDAVDNVAYGMKKRLTGCKTRDIATLLFQTVEGMKTDDDCTVAKFVLGNCGLVHGQIVAAVQELVNVPATEVSTFFENPRAVRNIEWFARAYGVKPMGGGGSK